MVPNSDVRLPPGGYWSSWQRDSEVKMVALEAGIWKGDSRGWLGAGTDMLWRGWYETDMGLHSTTDELMDFGQVIKLT